MNTLNSFFSTNPLVLICCALLSLEIPIDTLNSVVFSTFPLVFICCVLVIEIPMNTLVIKLCFFYKPSSVHLLCATRHRNSKDHIKIHSFSTNPPVFYCYVLLLIEIPMNMSLNCYILKYVHLNHQHSCVFFFLKSMLTCITHGCH